jgi:ubiquitin carboxyl-terminal hydrolase 1
MNYYHGHPAVPNPGQHDFSFAYSQQNIILSVIGGFIFVLWFIFPYVGILPAMVAKALWQVLVYIVPSHIVATLDKTDNTTNMDSSAIFSDLSEKSAAMKRIVGLDKSSLYSILPRRGRSLSGAFLGGRDSVPPGLGNWDNSCYQNSVIQGLSSLESFASFLDRNTRKLEERGLLNTHQALKEITGMLNDPTNHGQMFWIPSELKSMSSWQQQDAQEYFSKIMDQLDKETRNALKGVTTNVGLRFGVPADQVAEILDSTNQSSAAKDNAKQQQEAFSNPLEGMLAQRVGCIRCGWTEGLSLIPFNCLTVSIGREREYDIRDCLDDYMDLEGIEGVECARCTLLRTKDQLCRLIEQTNKDNDAENPVPNPGLFEKLRESAKTRLEAVQDVLEEQDFTEKALSEKCHIPSNSRVSVTKSRQAVIARPPKSLVFHINRSVFDENTGVLMKNHAQVRFPESLDLSDWCLGTKQLDENEKESEIWNTDPKLSMLSQPGAAKKDLNGFEYELRAVLTHYGRHENGHYICYRKFSNEDFPKKFHDAVDRVDDEKEALYHWFRLSDDDVQMVSQHAVLNQGGVFMLFYERIDEIEEEFHDAETHSDDKIPGVESVDNSLETSIDDKLDTESSDESRPVSSPGISTPSGTSGAESEICNSDYTCATPVSEASSQFAVMPDNIPLLSEGA